MKIIFDVFPAHLSVVPEGLLDDVLLLEPNAKNKDAYYVQTARVIVTEEAVVVAADSPQGAQIIFQERYSTFLKDSTSHIVTVSGKMLAFAKDENCGCGSRLRGWNPYRTLSSIKDL